LGEPRVPNPKPFVLKILISKFFENYILRDTVLQNPRWARLSGVSKENICSVDPPQQANPSAFAICIENLFQPEIHRLEAADATAQPTGRRPCHSVADS
jgi:hypothetical protein